VWSHDQQFDFTLTRFYNHTHSNMIATWCYVYAVMFGPALQPCPPPSLDLTLVSDHKFMSDECNLVSNADHMVVLTKIYSTERARTSRTL